MTWTNVAKPTGTPYTKATFQGFQLYDDSSITYDEADVFYDSLDPIAWSDVAKPSGNSTTTITPGMTFALMIPLTISSTLSISFTPWTKVSKPQ